jgi:hypothetical protein
VKNESVNGMGHIWSKEEFWGCFNLAKILVLIELAKME